MRKKTRRLKSFASTNPAHLLVAKRVEARQAVPCESLRNQAAVRRREASARAGPRLVAPRAGSHSLEVGITTSKSRRTILALR